MFFDHFIIADNFSDLCYKTPGQIYRLIIESGISQKYEKGLISSQTFYTQALETLGIEQPFLSFQDFIPLWSDIFTPNKKMLDFIQTLKCRKVMLSNTNELHFMHIETRFQLSGLFDDLVLSYKENSVKPECKIFEKTIQKAGCPPENILYIDDIPEYTRAFSEFGVNTITYTPSEFEKRLSEFRIIT